MLKSKINQGFYQFLILVFLVVILAVISVLFDRGVFYEKVSNDPISLRRYATNIISLCSKERYHPACYDTEIPKLMDRGVSMEDAFKVTAIIQSLDSTYPYCHVLAHELAGKEVDKDPSKWKDVAARAPASMCSYGGLHGAFQERFRAENLTPEQVEQIKPELMDVCDKRDGWDPTSLQIGGCYHALGHLSMYLTKADIKASLKLCNDIGMKPDGRNLTQSCYDGVFMQLFQPLEPEDFALIKGKEIKPGEQSLTNFCSQFNGKERVSCWSEGWPGIRSQILTPKGLVSHCSSSFLQDPSYKDMCYMSAFYVIIVQFRFDMKALNSFCSELPESVSNICYKAGASRLITTDYSYIPKAVDFCSTSKRQSDQDACYSELVRYALYSFGPGTKESTAICESLPPKWQSQCNVQ